MFTKVFVYVLIISAYTVNVCWSFNFVFNDGPFRSLFNNFQSMGNDFGPVFEVNKNFKEPELESSASEFNPSVVIVDAGKAQTIPVDASWEQQQNIQGPIFPFFRPNIWQSIFTGIRRPVPWWKGENICIERKVIEEGSEEDASKNTTKPTESDAVDTNPADSISVVSSGENVQMQISDSLPFTFSSQITHCVDDETAHICTTRVRNSKLNKTTIVRHECCHGYRRNQNGLPGCSAVNLKSIVETLNEMGSKHFADLLTSSSVEKRIQENENLTIFSPLDETLMALYNKKENEISPINVEHQKVDEVSSTTTAPQTTPSISISPAIVARHTLNGIYKLNDFTDGEILTTLDDTIQLRVNIYNNMRKVITLNCVPIISGDNPTINGVIHSVERVLPSANKTLGQLLEADQRFAKFTELLKEVGAFEKLNELNGQFTIFAPTNAAIEKNNFLDKLKGGHSCFKNLIETHVANKMICSSGIFGEMPVKTINSMQIALKRTYDYKLFAQNAEIIERDITGSNGVIHAISDLIISDSVEPFSKSIDTPVTRKFVQLLNETNLADEFNGKEDATFFIPTDEAFQKLPDDVREKFLNDTEMIMRFHITQPRLTNTNFYNNELLVSSIGKSVRINLYGEFPHPITRVTAQCANIVYQNKETCGGVIHLVDRVLFPSKDSIIAIVESQSGFEIFKELLQVSKFTEKLSNENGPYTLLLPDDAAFRKTFSQKEIDEYLNNANKATKLVQRHIIPEFVCCTGFNQMPFFFSLQQFRVLDGTSVSAIREFDGRIKVGSAQVRKCDKIANNGVVHFIDRVLYPKAMVNMLPANSLFNMFLN